MDTDPEMNVVVFLYRKWAMKRNATSFGPTRASDSIQTAWRRVVAENRITADQIREIYSEWSPSPEDAHFISTTFPGAQVSCSFERPADGNWDLALAKAHGTMATHQAMENREAIRRTAPLLPILRNEDAFVEMIVNRPVIPGFRVYLAYAGPTPTGTQGIDYVTRKSLQGTEGTEEDLWAQAYQNLAEGLVIKGVDDEGAKILFVESAKGFAASALGLPNFVDNVLSWLPAPRITIGIESPDSLFLWTADTPLTRELYRKTLQSTYWGAVALTPSIFSLQDGILSVVAERPKPTTSTYDL